MIIEFIFIVVVNIIYVCIISLEFQNDIKLINHLYYCQYEK